MVKRRQKQGEKRQPRQQELQPFDTTFKAWIKEQARDILPLLLPGTILLEAIDVERIKPTMRVDRVFKILYKGKSNGHHLSTRERRDTQGVEDVRSIVERKPNSAKDTR